MKTIYHFFICCLFAFAWVACQSNVTHPHIFVTTEDREDILQKIEQADWAKRIFNELKAEVDPILAIHRNDPSYVISRMQMHWEPGKRYTRFYTDGNFVTRREGNAKYPTVRITYGRAASNSVPLAPLDKMISYSDGSLTKPKGTELGIVKLTESPNNQLSKLGSSLEYDTVPFTQTGLGVETVNRGFVQLAWKSAILYYLTQEEPYAKLAADIVWTIVRGAAQQEQLNPDWEKDHDGVCMNGYLSFETLGDTRHFATLPLAYDMIYNYLRDVYFDLPQFTQGIEGEWWAPAHTEGKEWAWGCFETMFKRLIENKLNRGGGLHGNWNMNEQQSAMLYALALESDTCYADGKGREYYVNKLIYGPTTPSHGAYIDVLRANISPVTGLWPEAPAGYGQGSSEQLIRFGYIYYKNGIDLLGKDSLLRKVPGAMPQMMFPNGYITNIGDASYSTMSTSQIELMMAYAHDKGDGELLKQMAGYMKFAKQRNLDNEFYHSLFFYLPEVPETEGIPQLSRTSYSSVYSCIIGRNNASNPRDALAFSLAGFGKDMGHRQPNGLTMELYGRGHILAPDQGIGADYWSRDTHEYKVNVAGHNTVSPNGKGADNNMPQNIELLYAEPAIVEGGEPESELTTERQFVEVLNHFYTSEVKADQRRALAIVRTSPETGYYVDIFRSDVVDDMDYYHDYIYHNMGIASEFFDAEGKPMELAGKSLDGQSGKGYSFFTTLGSKVEEGCFHADFHLGIDSTHMRMFMPQGKGRTIYQLSSPHNHRYYVPDLRQQPVPAVLVRQEGEAWNQPFIAVYEPYGNGVEAQICSVCTDDTDMQSGIAKLSVTSKQRTDYIIHSVHPNVEAHYRDIRFKGTFVVLSVENGEVSSVYMVDGRELHTQGLNVTSTSGEPFNAWITWKDGKQIVRSEQNLQVTRTY